MRRILVVFNPVSGSPWLRFAERRILRELSIHGIDVRWLETKRDTRKELTNAVLEGFDRIIVIGGDGTVREVAEILIAHKSTTPLAILAQGTGNVLAMSLGIPLFPLRHAIQYALRGKVESIDAMKVNGKRISLIGAGQGYDTLFIQGAPRTLKQRIGIFAYILSFLRTFFPYRAQRYTIVVDGERHQVMGKLVLALNIFSVVGLPLERDVSAHDGLIDLFVFNPRTIWGAVGLGIAFLLRLPRQRIPRLQSFKGKHVSIRQRKGRHIQIDGEIYGDKHLDIEILPKALRLVHTLPN